MSELSEAQVAANRANAGRSTGPRTEEGKKRSSLNAMRHGLTGRAVVLPAEDPHDYEAFAKRIVDSLEPGSPVERGLAQLVADQQWRLGRIKRIEDALMGEGSEACVQDFTTLAIYTQRLYRVMMDAQRQIGEMQAQRKKAEEAQKAEAIRQYRLHKMLEMEWNPAEHGFVYSEEELEAEIERQTLHLAALSAGKWNYDRAKFEAWRKQQMGAPDRRSQGGPWYRGTDCADTPPASGALPSEDLRDV